MPFIQKPWLAWRKYNCWYLITGLTIIVLFSASIGESQAKYFPEGLGHTAIIEDIKLHYKMWQPQGTPKGKVTLIHGLFGSTFSWRYTAPFLQQQGYFVVAVDLAGFGYSDRKRGVDHSQQNRSVLVWQLLSEIDASLGEDDSARPWDFIGHSMGGGTITALASSNPERTRSLVYVAGAVYNQPPAIGRFLFSIPGINNLIAFGIQRFILTQTRLETTLASAYGRTPTSEELEGYIDPILLPGTAHAFLDITRTQGPPIHLELPKINQPVLLIWGENDSWVPVSEGQRMSEDIPQSKLIVIPDSGHCPMETHPQLFNKYLLEFLEPV